MDRAVRKQILDEIVRRIRAGQFQSGFVFLGDLFNSAPPAPGRGEYKPPFERDSLNYGYMTSGEVGAGNSEAF